MSKVTKNERISTLEKQLSVMQTQISSLIECAHSHTARLIALEPDNPFHGKFYKPERDTAKELAEVDLSSELTGSDLARAMLARGDYHVMCAVSDISESDAILSCNSAVITSGEIRGAFTNSFDGLHEHAVPINNQGEPLTASEVGL